MRIYFSKMQGGSLNIKNLNHRIKSINTKLASIMSRGRNLTYLIRLVSQKCQRVKGKKTEKNL